MFVAGFDACGGGYPDDGNEGSEAERDARVLEGDGNGDEIDEKGEPVFALDCCIFCFKFAGVTEAPADGEVQAEEAEAGDDHRRDVNSDREGVHLLVEHIGSEERQKGETEEKGQICVKDELVDLFGAVDELVVVDPVNAGEGEGDEIEAEGGENGAQAFEPVLVGNFEFEHHDGDDDGDDSVGEGLKAGWFEEVVGHGGRDVLVQAGLLWLKDTTAIVTLFERSAELESSYDFEFHGIRGATGCDEGRACGLFA